MLLGLYVLLDGSMEFFCSAAACCSNPGKAKYPGWACNANNDLFETGLCSCRHLKRNCSTLEPQGDIYSHNRASSQDGKVRGSLRWCGKIFFRIF